METILAIDPSINHVGFALLQIGKQWNWETVNLESKSLQFKCEELVSTIVTRGLITQLVCEYPQFMAVGRGLIAAQRGYTLDLACICGYLAGYYRIAPSNIFYYTPNQWKGQRPKSATLAAFKRTFPKHTLPSEHAIDATMLLHYHATKYNLL